MQIDIKNSGFVFVLGAFLVGCTGAMTPVTPVAPEAAASTTTGSEVSSLRCAVGHEVKVSLPANPSTGFSWGFAEEPDATILAPAGTTFTPATESIVGAGGESVWTFRGVAPGTTSFTLVYRRVWESDVEPARQVRYEVSVESPS